MCQNTIFGPSSNVKIKFQCQIRYSAQVRISKSDFECQNAIFGPSSNVKIGFRMSKFDIWPEFESQNRLSNVKFDIRPQFECQNRILNVKKRYSVRTRMSK